ncbi:MAG: threonine/serine exporter family protein [Ruminiclostridium sp.]|nr:threonine/serine exporter family protein [Ruminiclostridium sp.]
MTEHIIQIVAAGLGTAGFALFFSVNRRHLVLASLGGMLSWLLYLAAWEQGAGVFLSTLLSAACICLWSEILARIRKAPANIFLLPGIVPLLPGSALYYTMEGIVGGDMAQVMEKGSEAGAVAVGIAAGIILGSELFRLYLSVRARRRKVMERKMAAQQGEN